MARRQIGVRVCMAGWDGSEELFCVRCRGQGSIALPVFILVRIGIIADSSDDLGGDLIHKTSRFHFETDNAEFISKVVSHRSVFDDSISRANQSMMNLRIIREARWATLKVCSVAAVTCRARRVLISRLEKLIFRFGSGEPLLDSRVLLENG